MHVIRLRVLQFLAPTVVLLLLSLQYVRDQWSFFSFSSSCGAGLGMALWILESFVVLLDATDPTNVKGCTVTPPYLDEYGEADPGLRQVGVWSIHIHTHTRTHTHTHILTHRRGNPLHLNDDMFRDLRLIWFHHRIPERICKETEENRSLIRITWGNMWLQDNWLALENPLSKTQCHYYTCIPHGWKKYAWASLCVFECHSN